MCSRSAGPQFPRAKKREAGESDARDNHSPSPPPPPPPPTHPSLFSAEPFEKLPVIRYREGEPLSDLVAAVAAAAADGAPPSAPPPRFEVRVPADAATNTNRAVRARQLWGTDAYTHDSDVVAVLMHQG